MNGVSLNVEKFNTPYFQVDYCIEKFGGRWKGEVRILRRDTFEEVSEGVVCIDSPKDKVEQEVYNKLESKIDFLKTEPPDWGSNVRRVLILLQKLHNSIVGFSLNDVKLPDDSGEFFEFCKKTRSETLQIVREVEKLSEQERLDILTTSEKYLNGIEDSWTIDNDSSLRLSIFDYFLKPSEEETVAYNRNLSKVTKAGAAPR